MRARGAKRSAKAILVEQNSICVIKAESVDVFQPEANLTALAIPHTAYISMMAGFGCHLAQTDHHQPKLILIEPQHVGKASDEPSQPGAGLCWLILIVYVFNLQVLDRLIVYITDTSLTHSC